MKISEPDIMHATTLLRRHNLKRTITIKQTTKQTNKERKKERTKRKERKKSLISPICTEWIHFFSRLQNLQNSVPCWDGILSHSKFPLRACTFHRKPSSACCGYTLALMKVNQKKLKPQLRCGLRLPSCKLTYSH